MNVLIPQQNNEMRSSNENQEEIRLIYFISLAFHFSCFTFCFSLF